MLRPKYPDTDTYTITTTSPTRTAAVEPAEVHPPATTVPASASRPVIKVTPATLATGTAAVLVVGTVLVSMLLAVAITAGSIALLAVVLRSMSNSQHRNR